MFFQASHDRNQKEEDFYLLLKTTEFIFNWWMLAWLLNRTHFQIILLYTEEITKKGKWAKNSKYTEQMIVKNEK